MVNQESSHGSDVQLRVVDRYVEHFSNSRKQYDEKDDHNTTSMIFAKTGLTFRQPGRDAPSVAKAWVHTTLDQRQERHRFSERLKDMTT